MKYVVLCHDVNGRDELLEYCKGKFLDAEVTVKIATDATEDAGIEIEAEEDILKSQIAPFLEETSRFKIFSRKSYFV